jgi:hypothetical protein
MRAVLTDPGKSDEEQFAVWRDAMSQELSDEEVMDLMQKAKQRMGQMAAEKPVKKAKQAVAEISLGEGPSLPSTLKSIATNGEPITQLYGKLKAMAKRWVENNGSLKGFHRNAAGQSAQWFHNFYFDKLQADLYALSKQSPRYAAPLINYLKDASEDRESRITFTEISRSLPPILFKMGKQMGDQSLTQFAYSWNSRREEYESYLANLETEADTDDEYDEPEVKPEKSKVPGQQNAQVEQIVNDILAKLPKKVAGDIRNAIARAPNKLQALQQELSKRKIQGVAEGVPQPGESSGAPKKFGPDAKIETDRMTVKQIISSIPGVPYYNNVVDDWDAKDYSWGVTKKTIEYATYLKEHPESLAQLPPILVLNGKFEDGAHRVSAIWLLQQRMDPKNPLWKNAKLNVHFVEQGVAK